VLKAKNLIAVISGLIIGAAIFIFVAEYIVTAMKSGFAGQQTFGNTTAAGFAAINRSAAFNTSADGLQTLAFTSGSLMAIAAVAVIGFWIVKSVIGTN